MRMLGRWDLGLSRVGVGLSVLTWVTDMARQTLVQVIGMGSVGAPSAGCTQCVLKLPTVLLHPVTCSPEGAHTQNRGHPREPRQP